MYICAQPPHLIVGLDSCCEAGARKAALGDLKGQNAVLQEIFWEDFFLTTLHTLQTYSRCQPVTVTIN